MPLGPGKFDHLCTYVREQAKADLAIVIVHGRTREQCGFSVQIDSKILPLAHQEIPNMLRTIAKEIEASLKAQA